MLLIDISHWVVYCYYNLPVDSVTKWRQFSIFLLQNAAARVALQTAFDTSMSVGNRSNDTAISVDDFHQYKPLGSLTVSSFSEFQSIINQTSIIMRT